MSDIISLSAPDIDVARFGARAGRLAKLINLDLPVPDGVVLSTQTVAAIADGLPCPKLPETLLKTGLLCVRSSAIHPDWGGPSAILNIGMNDAYGAGADSAMRAYCRFIQSYGVAVDNLDPELFENLYYAQLKRADVPDGSDLKDSDIAAMLTSFKTLYAAETGQAFPQDKMVQLNGAFGAMARAWNAPSASILRMAKGAPDDAGLALIVQDMAQGSGESSHVGIVQMVDAQTGRAGISGQYSGQPLTNIAPDTLAALSEMSDRAAAGMGDAFQFKFTLTGGAIHLLDATAAKRTSRAAVRIAVDLANRGAISRNQALLRIDPQNLVAHLHSQIDPDAERQVFGTGLPASPGAATGKIVFTPEAAMASEAREEPCILVRVETSPEDIRGMHAAVGVLTMRGGMTSHAAVIARGLGLPCVVGAADLRLDLKNHVIRAENGQEFSAGDTITIDGTRGQAVIGAPKMIQPELGRAFVTLMDWADAVRTIGVRANADTPMDARVARDFKVDGIGLCRTEHMFFEADRITVMREMILANTEQERRATLERLLPMQRSDFMELFEIMRGLPVTIRLLDPPLHEFLPHDRDEIQALAKAMDIPLAQVMTRAAELKEYNPMLGKRGVRLGVTMPEIYEMQARAIFEAAVEVNRNADAPVVPEIMIPLVSANREVELVKERVDRIAIKVRAEKQVDLDFKLGVMVETPRAALRAGDLAKSAAFLSFGTNDLTQMTYGLSRDDAGRFMRDYINLGVYPEDPFHTLDLEGVGELLLMAAKRGRAENDNLTLGLCGEHGGDPASVRFCKLAGFDYVSCSPFRVPIARLAAAQASILSDKGEIRF
ncbi:MAG: pyruvate, phosphate dikinase [Paracoccaceae bacterium]